LVGVVTTAAAGWEVVADAACDVGLEGSNSRRADAANAHRAGVVAGVVGDPPAPVAGTLAVAALMRGTRDGLTVAVAAGAAVRLADLDDALDAAALDGREAALCARLLDGEAEVSCEEELDPAASSALATALPEAMAAPTPKATASAPSRPTCAAAFIEGLIDFTPVGSFSDLTVPNREPHV
jgi:hypothetical protein